MRVWSDAEPRKLTAAKLAHEKPGQALQATALGREVYLRLVGSDHRAELGPVRHETAVDSALLQHCVLDGADAWGEFSLLIASYCK
jgi:hypothetical protein